MPIVLYENAGWLERFDYCVPLIALSCHLLAATFQVTDSYAMLEIAVGYNLLGMRFEMAPRSPNG